jgi:prophage DNA circulation protein
VDWRDRLRPATFRGVPFEVDASDRDGGRAGVLHTYPGRDKPYYEDLGAAPHSHTVEAFLIGPGCLDARDRLLEALNRAGPGELVHPWLGTLQVACSMERLRHSTAEGGLVRLSLTFVETSPPLFPETFVNPRAAAAEAETATVAAAEESFNATVIVEGVPGWVNGSMADELDRLHDQLLEVDLSAGLIEEVAHFTALVDAIGSLAVDAVRLGDFPTQLHDALGHLEDAFTSHEQALRAYLQIEAYRGTQIGYGSGIGQQADSNAFALELLVRAQTLAAAVRLAAGIAWPSYEDALAARDELAARLEALTDQADDTLYQALLDLQAALAAGVPDPNQALPHLQTFLPRASTSTLLLAYRFYDDIGREAEIVARNDPPYPGFLRGLEPVELLVDAGA